ncbi:ATP-binding cassette, subfamily B [Anaerosporobacter mobilis DSM 15930]|uniref:ATP-binding cassette, subfamily B n=1 Tax=Anaerosporobacter mobilis DSM 15930 TaxID=1120996 RepID=A0A1M7F4U3_9FIRM|nr:ABC transporter ATP-binding protein/permease [Anaerosporobacter mobilis]SHL99082.1 ATP-binding cassette, subfamily B [Anaerosporobacter mobilis DSM 15930]
MFHKRLLQEFKDNQKQVVGMVLTQWISLLSNVALMFVIANTINTIVKDTFTTKQMVQLFLTFVAVILIRGGMTKMNDTMSYLASTKVKSRLREVMNQKLMDLGTRYRKSMATSEIVQISTEGVEQLEIYFGRYVPQFFYSLLAPITLFVIVSFMSIKVALVLLLCVPLIPVSIIAVQKFAKKMLNKYWGIYTGLGDTFLENLQGLTTLKIYQADERYAKKMDEEAEKFRKITMRVLIMQLNSISVMDLIAYGGAAVGIILSILEYRSGQITFVQCLFIMLIAADFFLPLRLLGSFFHIAMNGNAAANKIFALLDMPVDKNDFNEQDGKRQDLKANIKFNKVTFGYEEGQTVINDISFVIPKNSYTALVGTSGCGKSTIASLIMNDNRPNEGHVLMGDCDINDLSEEFIHNKITRIRHDSYLFKGTVEDNLRMGSEQATKDEMLHALEQVDLLETIMEKGGLSMEITEKAANLSGGQKQRIALARAILHDSEVYIFDEATSNIDVESENKIMEVIHTLAKTKTVILISHRLANVVKADQVLVMKNGKIIETGTHEDLMRQQKYYHQLYTSQKELEKYTEEVAN